MSDSPELTAALIALIEPLVAEAVATELQRRSMVTPNPGQLLTTAEVAKLLQIHERTVQRQCAIGQLTSVRVGNRWRVRREDVPGAV